MLHNAVVSSDMAPKMTTSSYAVLALLDLRPWTGYELTQQAQRSLRYAWPKSERLLYSEPKRLVDRGYATTHREKSGNRSRNVYEITPEGREALNEWTSSRTQPPRIEIEALLRSGQEMLAVVDVKGPVRKAFELFRTGEKLAPAFQHAAVQLHANFQISFHTI